MRSQGVKSHSKPDARRCQTPDGQIANNHHGEEEIIKRGKSKSSMEAKSKRKEAEGSANEIHEAMGNMIGDFSKQTLTSESERLLAKLQPGCRLPPADARAVVTELARLAGTDTARNDADPQGDGDQSPVTAQTTGGGNGAPSRLAGAAFDAAEPYRQVLRELWSAGGDLESHLRFGGFSSFAMGFCLGDARSVKQMLRGTATGSEARRHLLERREAGMRFTPLILTIAVSKVKGYASQITGAREADMDHVGVVKTLLRYGARPDCKELTGKTVVHYGAGSRATDESLNMVDYCFEAAKSAAHLGKTIVLRNLKAEQFNGESGVLGGFDAVTGRREVTLETKKQLSILPCNIFEGGGKKTCIYDPSRNLLNDCDRVGTTSLHEVFLSPLGRTDVASFLIQRNVSVDIAPPCGNSLRKLVYTPTPLGPSTMHNLIRKHIIDIEKGKNDCCWGCGKLTPRGTLPSAVNAKKPNIAVRMIIAWSLPCADLPHCSLTAPKPANVRNSTGASTKPIASLPMRIIRYL